MRPVRGDGRDQTVQFVSLLLQLLHQGLDGSLGERLGLTALTTSSTHFRHMCHNVKRNVSVVGEGSNYGL